jgi:hypothetical protein
MAKRPQAVFAGVVVALNDTSIRRRSPASRDSCDQGRMLSARSDEPAARAAPPHGTATASAEGAGAP